MPDSKLLYKFAEGVTAHPVKFDTAPPGAKIYVSDYSAGAGEDLTHWQFAGVSPLTFGEIPNFGYYRVRAVKEGFASADQVFFRENAVALTLQPVSATPQGKAWVPPGTPASTATSDNLSAISLPGFWIDRYEVTNQEFKEFVDAAGYRNREYWKETFVKDGHRLSFEEAISEFHDLTGRPGPANWTLSAYPEGTANLPVAGVSWYEAMAYAEFAGKSIPTVYEWRRAAPIDVFNANIVLMSNFSGKALTPVGAHQGMSEFGSYDMAGNVKEWTSEYCRACGGLVSTQRQDERQEHQPLRVTS